MIGLLAPALWAWQAHSGVKKSERNSQPRVIFPSFERYSVAKTRVKTPPCGNGDWKWRGGLSLNNACSTQIPLLLNDSMSYLISGTLSKWWEWVKLCCSNLFFPISLFGHKKLKTWEMVSIEAEAEEGSPRGGSQLLLLHSGWQKPQEHNGGFLELDDRTCSGSLPCHRICSGGHTFLACLQVQVWPMIR